MSRHNAEHGHHAGEGHGESASIFGQRDTEGRVVFGPNDPDPATYTQPRGAKVAPLPEFLQGDHVTLFGLASSPAACDDAMTCSAPGGDGSEPPVVQELLASSPLVPRWGCDTEDSQTPLREALVAANENLGQAMQRHAGTPGASMPFKRFPGLALPTTFLLHGGDPVPLHVYDFGLWLFQHWDDPRALVFYVPKLENEEEAAYLHELITEAERRVAVLHPSYKPGTVRVLVVLENPRAIFRANEIMDALHPFFAGASLGWHDYIAATARLYRNDPNYHIPIKADPTIVIKHIKASHELVASVVGGRGGVAIGGMYGVLPDDGASSESVAAVHAGLFKDLATQLKRGLHGFWVGRSDVVRTALAFVEAWRRNRQRLPDLVRAVLGASSELADEVLAFIDADDVPSLPPGAPRFDAALVVADVRPSKLMANNDPAEVRYNVLQTLQYLTDWISGNGCVALPGSIRGHPVHILDDLATVERSRWELWAEVQHGRYPVEDFVRVVHEVMRDIRGAANVHGKGEDESCKFEDLHEHVGAGEARHEDVHVAWSPRTQHIYPIAVQVLLRLVTDPQPVEFVTELLLPLTSKIVRGENGRLEGVAERFDAGLTTYVRRFHYFFERCGSVRFARHMAHAVATDSGAAERIILGLSVPEVIAAASFHGDIGKGRKTLDSQASREQAAVFAEGDADKARQQLGALGDEYLAKFGFKFLVSAQGKTATELLDLLKQRMGNSPEQEHRNACAALWEITSKRLNEEPLDSLMDQLQSLRIKHGIKGASVCVDTAGDTHVECGDTHAEAPRQTILLGQRSDSSGDEVGSATLFEIASLSKTIASAFCIEYFVVGRGISLNTSVNVLLEEAGSPFRLTHAEWGNEVLLRHLMSHCALNLHYVNGVPLGEDMPPLIEFLTGNEKYGYDPIDVVNKPGTVFKYSGAGFIVLEHLLQCMEGGAPTHRTLKPFLDALGVGDELTFELDTSEHEVAFGFSDDGGVVEGTRKQFPGFAAGALGTARAMNTVLRHLSHAYRNLDGSGPISHDTAVEMLFGTDRGCKQFMGCEMGVGVFVAEGGLNKFAMHQGANDGFRGVYLYCVDGPDAGRGMTLFANGDNRAMFFIAEAMQAILREMRFHGVDLSALPTNTDLDISRIPQEKIVNYGYKNLVFCALQPTLPDEIIDRGPPDPLAAYNVMTSASVRSITNQRFALAHNLVSDHLPIFDPELFCPMGKVMDSWETARHNSAGVDTCVLSLTKTASAVRYVLISTKYHNGNQAPAVQLWSRPTTAKIDAEGQHIDNDGQWEVLVPKMSLNGHAEARILLSAPVTVAEVKVEIFPDGGLSRVALFENLPQEELGPMSFLPIGEATSKVCADVIPTVHSHPLQLIYAPTPETVAEHWKELRPGELFDVASLSYGGSLVAVTDQHYGPARQVLSPYIPLSMHDGFESKRSREPGHFEELVLALGKPSVIESILFDFTYFVNNNPRAVSVDALSDVDGTWTRIVEPASEDAIKPFAGNTKRFVIQSQAVFSQIRVHVVPDGGINRVRVMSRHNVPE